MQIEVPTAVDPLLAGLVMAKLREAVESGHMVDIRIFIGRTSRQTGLPTPPRIEVLDRGDRGVAR